MEISHPQIVKTRTADDKSPKSMYCSVAEEVPSLSEKATPTPKPPILLAFRSSKWFVTGVIAYAVFTEQSLYAIITPVEPFAVSRRLGIPDDQVQQWITILFAVYGIATVVSSPPWGWWSDRQPSRRLPFLFGLAALVAAVVMLWLATNKAVLLIGRALQGVASTVVWTTGLAVLVDTVGEARIGQYMGWVGLALNVGTLVGPMLGGVVFSAAGYNPVFIMALGVLAVDIALRLVVVEKHTREQWLPADCSITTDGGIEASALHQNMLPLSQATTEICRTTDSSQSDLAKDGYFEDVRAKSRWHLPPVVKLLFSPRFISALWGVMVQASLYSGLQTVLPLYCNTVFGWDSTGGGLIFIPLVAPGLLGPLVGMLCDRFGPRWLTTAGFLGMLPSLALMRFVDQDSIKMKASLCVLLVDVGICATLTLEPLMAEITYLAGLHDEDSGSKTGSYAQAYCLFNLAWGIGDIVGPFWAGMILQAAGWQMLTLTLGLLGGVSAIPMVLYCGGWLFAGIDSSRR